MAAPTQSVVSPAFLEQRNVLVNEIAQSLENVLQNINRLNRSLEGVIAVGNEFGAVEALWSQFENVTQQGGQGGEDANANTNSSTEGVMSEQAEEVAPNSRE